MNQAKRMAVIFLFQLGLTVIGGVYVLTMIHLAIHLHVIAGIALGVFGMLASAWWLSKE